MALKDILASLSKEKCLNDEQLVCMYAKDISVVRGVDVCEEETVEEIINQVQDEDEVRAVVEQRENE